MNMSAKWWVSSFSYYATFFKHFQQLSPNCQSYIDTLFQFPTQLYTWSLRAAYDRNWPTMWEYYGLFSLSWCNPIMWPIWIRICWFCAEFIMNYVTLQILSCPFYYKKIKWLLRVCSHLIVIILFFFPCVFYCLFLLDYNSSGFHQYICGAVQ